MTGLEVCQRHVCAQLLKRLTSDMYMQNYIDKGTVYLFDENNPTVAVDEVPLVAVKFRKIERRFDCRVYAVIHSVEWYGDCYSFLNVPKYPEDWKYLVMPAGMLHSYAQAYVWNTSDEKRSESGSVVVQWHDGKLWRVG